MKKAILFVVALILLSLITNAQKTTKTASTGGKAFDENTRVINIGIGFAGSYYNFSRGAGYNYRNSPVLSLSYEQPWSKRLGPGYLGVGAYVNFQSTTYRYENHYWKGERNYYQHSYRNYVAAGRAAYHWDGLNFEHGEVYGGAIIGLRFQTYDYSTNSNDPDIYRYQYDSRLVVRPTASVFAGARWYFSSKVGVFGELSGGYGIPYATGGLSIKF